MLSLTRSKDVLVKKCGYVPFYMRQLDRLKIARVYLPISPISPILRRDPLKADDRRCSVESYAHSPKRRSHHTATSGALWKLGKLCKWNVFQRKLLPVINFTRTNTPSSAFLWQTKIADKRKSFHEVENTSAWVWERIFLLLRPATMSHCDEISSTNINVTFTCNDQKDF